MARRLRGDNEEFRRGGIWLITCLGVTIFLKLVMNVLASRSKPASTRLHVLETDAGTFIVVHCQSEGSSIHSVLIGHLTWPDVDLACTHIHALWGCRNHALAC